MYSQENLTNIHSAVKSRFCNISSRGRGFRLRGELENDRRAGFEAVKCTACKSGAERHILKGSI